MYIYIHHLAIKFIYIYIYIYTLYIIQMLASLFDFCYFAYHPCSDVHLFLHGTSWYLPMSCWGDPGPPLGGPGTMWSTALTMNGVLQRGRLGGRGRSRLNVHTMVHCMWMSCIVLEWITMVFRCCLLSIQVWPHHCRIKLVVLCFTPLIPKGSKGLVLWQGCQQKWAMTKLDTSPIGPQTSYRARSKHGICRRPSLRQPGFLSQWMTPVEIDTYITIHNYPLAIGCSFL